MSEFVVHVPLSQGYVAVIDESDCHLAAFKWHAKVYSWGGVYAARNVTIDGKRVVQKLHRAVLEAGRGDPDIDHIDGDGLNCRRSNLRFVTLKENCRNRYPRARRDNRSSDHLGVSWHPSKGKFSAVIWNEGKNRHLGYFPTANEANAARLAAEKALWGITPRRAEAHGAPA